MHQVLGPGPLKGKRKKKRKSNCHDYSLTYSESWGQLLDKRSDFWEQENLPFHKLQSSESHRPNFSKHTMSSEVHCCSSLCSTQMPNKRHSPATSQFTLNHKSQYYSLEHNKLQNYLWTNKTQRLQHAWLVSRNPEVWEQKFYVYTKLYAIPLITTQWQETISLKKK